MKAYYDPKSQQYFAVLDNGTKLHLRNDNMISIGISEGENPPQSWFDDNCEEVHFDEEFLPKYNDAKDKILKISVL